MKSSLTILSKLVQATTVTLLAGVILLAGCSKPAPPPPAPAKPATAATAANGTNAVAAADAAPSAPETVSAFEILPAKDPFFPRSVRWEDKGPIDGKPAAPQMFSLVVNGMLASGRATLAVINGRAFSEKETGKVQVPPPPEPMKKMVRLQVLEIRKDAVLIKADGEASERLLPWKH